MRLRAKTQSEYSRITCEKSTRARYEVQRLRVSRYRSTKGESFHSRSICCSRARDGVSRHDISSFVRLREPLLRHVRRTNELSEFPLHPRYLSCILKSAERCARVRIVDTATRVCLQRLSTRENCPRRRLAFSRYYIIIARLLVRSRACL